tara:strand:- start:305 stop:559 length:255 start_codon:yes stop_codon:yes gene_type:complete
MESENFVLLLGLHRDLTDSYLYTIIPKEVVLTAAGDGSVDYIIKWAEIEFPDFVVMEDADNEPEIIVWNEEITHEWLTEIGCPE